MNSLKPMHYNQITGHSLGRLMALSDGIFGVAMTLLVFDLRIPAVPAIRTEEDLWQALVKFAPQLVMFAMSFMTLGIFWIAQQTLLDQCARTDRNLSWIHLTFLFLICLMPFSTRLLAEFITLRIALLMYWVNIFLTGLILWASWSHAERTGLLRDDLHPDTGRLFRRRVLTAQSLYAAGMSLCVVNTYLSLAFIVLVQLNYVLAPTLRRRV